MHKEYLSKIMTKQDLSIEEMKEMITLIMDGRVSDIMISALLISLEMKGLSIDEIAAAVSVMRDKSEKVKVDQSIIIDTCGTGGDYVDTYNVSTAAAFMAAAAGAFVVKHGNRAVTSKCGSADVLEELGAIIDINPGEVEEIIKKTNIGFLFAPSYHKAMKHVANVRKTLSIKTIFNILGPLTNPGNAKYQVIGVYDPNLTEIICEVLKKLGSVHVLCVSGLEGLDEISVSGTTKISELKNDRISTYYIQPEDFGIARADIDAVKGGSAENNADIIKNIFKGRLGPERDLLVLNAAAAIYIAQKADSLLQAARIAEDIIDSGKALQKLKDFIGISKKIGKKGGAKHVS